MVEPSTSKITRRGSMAVVFSQDRSKILLLRREIFILWDLPGGGIEPGEDPAEAAVRECREETGYDIAVDRLVGTYRHQSVYGLGDQLTYAYRAHLKGGTPKRIGLELTGLRWCSASEFPGGLQPLQRQMIADARLDPPRTFERHIVFPRWKLYPARVAFNIARAINNTLRFLLPRS
jgi:8-oxo-dGTP diphosphatase